MRTFTAILLTLSLTPPPAMTAATRAAITQEPPPIRVEAAGKFLLDSGALEAHELSGLTWGGPSSEGDGLETFYAVSDTRPAVFRLNVRLDERTGAVKEARVVERIELDHGADCEDIVWDNRDGTLWIADETGPTIRQFQLVEGSPSRRGKMVRELEIPPIFRTRRPNLGFEALAWDPDSRNFWTANEEALPADGEPSMVDSGSLVRLLQFGPDLQPAAQYAYPTEPVGARPPKGHSRERSGLVALACLPAGRLLALERALDVQRLLIADVPVFTSRLFLLDLKEASDVSEMTDGLKGRAFTAVRKTLLWQKRFGLEAPNNFEGMALGPRLADGSWSLVLISDDEKGMLEQSLLALRIYVEREPPAEELKK